jgi:NADH:ubiquinone oxidoreductase subunit 3 (subunit A)
MKFSMKYLAAAILFDNFSLSIAFLYGLFSIFQFHLIL